MQTLIYQINHNLSQLLLKKCHGANSLAITEDRIKNANIKLAWEKLERGEINWLDYEHILKD